MVWGGAYRSTVLVWGHRSTVGLGVWVDSSWPMEQVNTSWSDPSPPPEQKDRHDCKHYLPRSVWSISEVKQMVHKHNISGPDCLHFFFAHMRKIPLFCYTGQALNFLFLVNQTHSFCPTCLSAKQGQMISLRGSKKVIFAAHKTFNQLNSVNFVIPVNKKIRNDMVTVPWSVKQPNASFELGWGCLFKTQFQSENIRQWKFHLVAHWARGLTPWLPWVRGLMPNHPGHEALCPNRPGHKTFCPNHPWAQGLVPRVVRVQGLATMQFELVFHSPPPLIAKRSKSLVKTKSVQVSPPPEHRTTTPCTFTEWQKAFVGPHHQTKISRQKQPINH